MGTVKVARYNNFVATPSIFESPIVKQIDLYGKTIRTHVLPIDYTLLWYYFSGDRNKYQAAVTSQQFQL